MTDHLNLLIGVAMSMNFLALASSRLTSVIRAAAVQGVVLGILPLLMENFDWRILVVALLTMAVKGGVIPFLLNRAVRAAHIDRDLIPLIGFTPSLLLGAAATVVAVALAGKMPLLPEHAETMLIPGGLAAIFTGLVLLIGRVKAVSQVCGYLILENGIYLFGLLLLHSTPLIVEGGILLDLTVAIFVIGIIVDRIRVEFDTLDTHKLNLLRE